MERERFLEIMAELFDSGEPINISVGRMPSRRRSGESVPPVKAIECAEKLKAKLEAEAYPFDIPIVSAKDIQGLPDFSAYSLNVIGRALHMCGCKALSQVLDGAGEMTRVWLAREFETYAEAPRGKIEAAFQRRAE